MNVKECPYCAEEIKIQAVKCKHCGSIMPEQEQMEHEQMLEIQHEEAAVESSYYAEIAKERLRLSYLFFALGMSAGGVLAYYAEYHEIVSNMPWYFIPAAVGVGGYVIWSLFWGCQIVHQPIRNMFSQIFVIGNSASDLIKRVLGLWLLTYLIVIPVLGTLVGVLGGGLYKNYQYSSLARQEIY